MDFPLLSDKNYNYLHASLQKIQHQQTEEESTNYQDKQNQAQSSLCELSNNICHEDTKNQSGIQFYNKKAKQKDIGLSPWKNKSKDKELIMKQDKRLFSKHNLHSFLQKSDFTRSRTQNKENFDHQKGNHQKQNKLMKITSVILKKVQNREKKHTNYKPEHHQIEFIALMCKRKKYSMQVGENCFLKEKHRGNETQPIIYKTFTPKILNLHHVEQQNQKFSNKKLIKNALSGWTEETKENPKNITLMNDHWKAKSNQNKSKKNKKIFIVRDTKSTQARDVKQNLLLCRRGSLSVDKQKKGDYKSNNPLTRLLYQKYLNTIGVSNYSKQILSKHL